MTARRGRAGLPRQSERDFQGSVLTLARLHGWRHWHDSATNAPRRCRGCGVVTAVRRNAAGLPDLLLIRRPRLLWVELKAEDGVVSSDQAAMLDELRACGQRVYVWRPSDWAQIERVLR